MREPRPRALTAAQKAAAFDRIADAVPGKVLRAALGASSHQEVADRLGINYSTLKQYLRLRLLPGPDVAVRKRAYYSAPRVREVERAWRERREERRRAAKPRPGKYAGSPVLAEMKEMAAGGATYQQIGKRFGLSRQAVHQLLKRYAEGRETP